VRGSTGRLVVLIGGSSLALVGYGAVLPYLYSDVANARGLGGGTAAAMFTLFAVGSLVAAPLAGRWADGRNPVAVAAWSRVGVGLALALLGLGSSTPSVLLAAFLYGVGVAAVQPAIQVILLAWTPERRRRTVFAWQFIGTNLGLAVGGLIGGFLADLSHPGSMRPVFAAAVAAEFVSAAVVWRTARGAAGDTQAPGLAPRPAAISYWHLMRRPSVLPLLGVTLLLTLACYAQYESGLPAYALETLGVAPHVLGIAVAVNALVVAALTAPVIARTRDHDPAGLLAMCAAIWVGCWVLFALPMFGIGSAAVLIVLGYASVSVGETMLSPVLTPLAASISPEGATGRTLAAVQAAQTLATAVGPALSGVLLAAHLPAAFIAMQVAVCLGAIALAQRLRRAASVQNVRQGERHGAQVVEQIA
jgi:MFS family permease